MILNANDLRRIAKVAHARDLGFVELVALAKLNPAKAFKGAILRGDLRNQDLEGFDFTGAEFRGCDLTGADLSGAAGVTPEMRATAITDETTILPRAYFWATGKPPTWAEDWGRDSYGPWVTFRVPNTDVTQRMRWCPAGEFMMGSPDSEAGRFAAEGPRHRVVLKQGFWMFDTACSEALWFAVMNKKGAPRFLLGMQFPVTGVSWDDARVFVQRLNAALPGLAIDLPNEAQWEYACRAGTDTAYSFGKRPSKKRVCYGSESPVKVGTLPANPWGLFEMQGNVDEWCLDYWFVGYNGAPEDGSAWLDSGGAAERVIRGGSYSIGGRHLRASSRQWFGPTDSNENLGFRCARVQADSEAARAVAPADPASRSAERRPQGAAGDTVARRGAGTVPAAKPEWAITAGRDKFGRYATIQVPGTGVTQRLRWIPRGSFRIGSPPDEMGRFDEEGPQQDVTFADGYWLFETPVTQVLWEAVMGNNPSGFKSPTRPVETVNFAEATAFIDKLNAHIPGLRLSLPSEAEWEYACREGKAETIYAGNLLNRETAIDPVLDKIAWYAGNSSEGFDLDNGVDLARRLGRPEGSAKAGTWPVRLKVSNMWGLHDMLGNVSEWCVDHWRDSYDGLPPDGSAWLDKKGAAYHVIRGGSWNDVARFVRAAFRAPFDPTLRSNFLGFRCVRVQSDSEAERRAARSKPRERSERAATTSPRRARVT